MNDKLKELPIDLKEKLLTIAKKLPTSSQGKFVIKAGNRIAEVAADHPRAILYGAAGWVLGEIIDNIFTIDIPLSDITVCLTADTMGEIGGVSGALFGFFEDTQSQTERRKIAKIIGEEIRASNSV